MSLPTVCRIAQHHGLISTSIDNLPMSIPIADFWRLLVESRLASPEQARQLQEMFKQTSGGDKGHTNAVALAQWMTTNGLLSVYQAKVLLSGHAGPFVFGDYLLYDRFEAARFRGTFRAVHLPTRERVLVSFHTGPLAQIEREWLNVVQQTSRFRQATHPHLSRVVQLIDLGQYKFTVLEDLEGQSAQARVAGGPMPWREACTIGQQIAAGLVRLAELRLLHGEICPANVWIDPQGNAKLLLPPLGHDPSVVPGPIDFLQPDPSGRLLMLAEYTAPELAQSPETGQKGAAPDWRTEIYALGCTLYHLMAGRPPFTGDDVSAKLMQHGTAEPLAPLESFGVPPWVAQVVSQMMDKNVTRRFQNPQQVVAALGAILQPASGGNGAQAPALIDTGIPEAQPMSATLPLDMSGAGGKQIGAAQPADASNPPAIEFPDFGTGAADFGFFDAIAAPPRRAQRNHTSGRVKLATAVLLLCAIGGVIFLAATTMKQGDKSSSAQAPAGTAKQSKQPDQAKATEENETDNSESSDSASVAGSELVQSPVVPLANQPGGDGRNKPAAEDSNALWVSPTHGTPISVDYVPAGAQAFLVVRPADLLRHAEGEKLLAALGPYGESARQEVEALAGAPLSEIEQLTIAWVEQMSADNTSTIVPIYIFRFDTARDKAKLLEQWNNPAPVVHGGEEIYPTPTGAAYLPVAQRGKVLIAGAAEDVQASAEQAGVAPPLRRAIEKMLLTSDSARQVVFLFAPNFVLQNGKIFFPGELETIQTPLQAFFGDDCRAAMISAHLTADNLFIEFCALGPVGQSPEATAGQFRERISKLPAGVKSEIAAHDPQPYSKQLLQRYPDMIRQLDAFTRAGAPNNEAVLRCYLPARAAHNLLMGSELALAETASTSIASSSAGGGSKQPESVAQRLGHVTSLVFAKETLEKALQLLGDDIGVKVEILGGDLQLEGITKNQSFGLDERNRPAGEILRKIMLQANPDGKLVYIVKPRVPGGEEMLFITTRKAVEKRGDKLPPELIIEKAKAK